MTEKKGRKPRKKAPARRSKPTPEELSAIDSVPPDPGILSKSSRAEGRKMVRLFRIKFDDGAGQDNIEYHEIINNRDRYVILDQDQTWDKDKGATTGLTVFLYYVDRFATPDDQEE